MSRFGRLLRSAGIVALTGIGATPAVAQFPIGQPGPYGSPVTAPQYDVYAASGHRRVAPPTHYAQPCPECPPATAPVMTPPGMSPPRMNPPGMMPQPNPVPDAPSPAAPDLFSGADAGPTSGLGGYIDNALPINVFRLRYDSAYGNNRPDRGEFFYAKCGCFGTPDAQGPPNPAGNVDFQELSAYMEYAIAPRLSLFANIPVRFINPDANVNAAGISDIRFGGKYAFLYSENRVLSLQTQVIVPTGRSQSGLGTANTWLETGLLYQEQLSARWQVFGQLKDQFSLDPQSDLTGNIMTYGLGTSYTVASGSWGYVAPVGELVGWTLLSGRELNTNSGMSDDATGDTIVNAKVGMRVGFGQSELGQLYPSRSDLYIGYGRALTGEVWYKDMFRVEYRLFY